MAIGRVQANSASPANGTTGAAAYTSSVTAGSFLVAVFNCEISGSQATTTAVSDNVNGSWTKATAATYSQGGWLGEVSVWVRANAAAGSTTVTATFSASAPSCVSLVEYSGMPSSVTVNTTATSNGTALATSHATGNATTTAACLLVGGFGDWGGNNTFTAGAGWAKATAFEATTRIQSMLEDQGVGTTGVAAGTYTASCTTSTSTIAAKVLVAFQASAGGGVTAPDSPGAARLAGAAQTVAVGRILTDRPVAVLGAGPAQTTVIDRSAADRAGAASARSPATTVAVGVTRTDSATSAAAGGGREAVLVGRVVSDVPRAVLMAGAGQVVVFDRLLTDRATTVLAGRPPVETITALNTVTLADRPTSAVACTPGQTLVVDRIFTDRLTQVVAGRPPLEQITATTPVTVSDRPGAALAAGPGQSLVVDQVLADRPAAAKGAAPSQVVLVDVIRQDRPGSVVAASPPTRLAQDVAVADRAWQVLAAGRGQVVVALPPTTVPTNWPPTFTGPVSAPLLLVSTPELAPLVLVSAPVDAPLVLFSGPVPAPSPGSTPHPMMARRGAFRRSLPAPADEFVIEQFRQLRARRRADKIRKANQ